MNSWELRGASHSLGSHRLTPSDGIRVTKPDCEREVFPLFFPPFKRVKDLVSGAIRKGACDISFFRKKGL